MITSACRAKNPLTCRRHGAAAAAALFTPFSQVRNFGVQHLAAYSDAAEAVRDALPEKLMAELEGYTFSLYSSINSYLRGGEAGLVQNILHEDYRNREVDAQQLARIRKRAASLVDITRKRVADLDQAFEMAERAAEPRVLYRTVRVWSSTGSEKTTAGEKAEYIASNFPIGAVVTNKAYTSTSIDSDFMLSQARRRPSQLIVQEILTNRGLAIQDDAPGTIQHIEREVLLARNMKFEVLATGHSTFEASGSGPEMPHWISSTPQRKRYPVVQLREVR
jgi:hypothetical protein